VVVIDPGPDSTAHADALSMAVGSQRVMGVLVTHTHPDHAPLANPLGRLWGAPTCGQAPGPDFSPDLLVTEGDRIRVGSMELVVIHTPGHSRDHLCFLAGAALFTGDHIMGGTSVVVEDLGDYLKSLKRLRNLPINRLYPGHGPEMERPHEVIDWYLAHRMQREEEILGVLTGRPVSVDEIVERVYREVDRSLYPLAAINVTAHLRKLADEGRAVIDGRGARLP
jgi:glyoxylase-like metal-dependent hydrolase (beta-lactamase superfamily II)